MSTLRTNALEGVDAKNSITIVAGVGNVTTTNVQSGIAKAWVHGSASAGLTGSFAISSGVDNGTGDYSYNLTNPVESDENSVFVMSPRSSSDRAGPAIFSTTSRFIVHVFDISSESLVDSGVNVTVHGNLA